MFFFGWEVRRIQVVPLKNTRIPLNTSSMFMHTYEMFAKKIKFICYTFSPSPDVMMRNLKLTYLIRTLSVLIYS